MGYVLVGDNIDKQISPWTIRMESQVQSLHYFHSCGAHNRTNTNDPVGWLHTHWEYAQPASMDIPTLLRWFHHYSRQLRHLGGLHCRGIPNLFLSSEEICTTAYTTLQSSCNGRKVCNGTSEVSVRYVQVRILLKIGLTKTTPFCEGQFGSEEEALLGLEPSISDWHAEANFLQVHVDYQQTYKCWWAYCLWWLDISLISCKCPYSVP